MRATTLAAAALLAALCAASAPAQGYIHDGGGRTSASSDEDAAPKAPAPERKKAPERRSRRHRRVKAAKTDEAPPPRRVSGDPKTAIADYLRERLTLADKSHGEDLAFGATVDERWKKFFDGLSEDRKSFETSMARQRLNLVETLSAVGPDYRARTIKDFEQMQSTMLKSFEASQQEKTDQFFGRLLEDVKAYQTAKERGRSELLDASLSAWKDEKGLIEDAGKKESE